jgi:hypothetical protein
MAAGQGFKTFITGEVLTAGDVNGYLMQGINVFTNATARDAAITAPAEGQFAFTKDNNSLWYYDGAAWVASGATGDIEGVTAGVGISGGGTSGTVTVTNSMATAIDAKGDLVPGTGADTFARLAVGANDTVLTADSSTATGLKWATPASGSSFVGCVVFNTTDISISSGTGTVANFNSERVDTNGYHDNVTNNSRITIPNGYAGKYLIWTTIEWAANTSGIRRASLLRNGGYSADAVINTVNASTSGETQNHYYYYRSLSVGDYLEVGVLQTSGGNLNLGGTTPGYVSQFGVQYLGA